MTITAKLFLGVGLTALAVSMPGTAATASWNSSQTSGGAFPASTFTDEITQTNFYIGEAVPWILDGHGGHGEQSNNNRDIWCEMDVGEPDAVFTTQPAPLAFPMDATKAPSRYGAHCYASDGEKTRTFYSWIFDGLTRVQQSTVTIIDPDDETWDLQWYYDPTGNTAGFPAADATHIHLTTEAAFAASRRTTSVGDKVRLHIRTGIDIPIETLQTWDQAATTVYVGGFGGGKFTFVDETPLSGSPNSSAVGMTLFGPHASAVTPNWIINQGEILGTWDPSTGHFARSKILLAGNNGVVGTKMTAWRCKAEGCEALMTGAGTIFQDKNYEMFWIDSEGRNNQNYVLGFSGACRYAIARGCVGFQSNIAGTGDTKPGTVQDYADHYFLRISKFWRMSVLQCLGGGRGGWTGSGYSADYASQPFLRAYSAEGLDGHAGFVTMNRTCGRSLAEFGRASDSETIDHAPNIVVSCNDHDFNNQGAFLIKSFVGGIHTLCNVMYRPPLESDTTNERSYILFMNGARIGSGLDPNDTYETPCTLAHNIYVYEGDASFEHVTSDVTETLEQTGDGGTVPNVTKTGNILAAANVAGGGPYTSISDLSRGSKFQIINGATVDATVTTGPAMDVNGLKRSNPTRIGAHHATGPNVAVAAPSGTGTPQTIAENPYVSGDYVTTDEGDLPTIPDDPFDGCMSDVTWSLNGNDVANRHAPVYRGGGSGTLRQVRRYANRSGQVATKSATLVI
jgi:hypothetical protein